MNTKRVCYSILILLINLSCGGNAQTQRKMNNVDDLKTSKFCDNIDQYVIPTKYINQAFYVKLDFVNKTNDSLRYDFFFDSGAAVMSIDSVIIALNELPIRIGRKTVIRNLNGERITAYEGIIDSHNPVKILINKDTVSIFECLITRGKNVFPMGCLPQNKIVNVNVKQEYIALLDSIQYKSNEFHYMREYYTNLPLIETTIHIEKDGVKIPLTGKFGLDLGLPAALALKTNFIEQHKDSIKFSEVLYLTPFENIYSTNTILEDAEIDFSHIKSIHKVDFSPVFTAIKETSFLTGLFGHDMMSHYDIAFDIKNKIIYISPIDTITANNENSFYKKWGINIDVVYDDKDPSKINELVISLVVKGRDGYNNGVRPGGITIEADNKPINFKALRSTFDSCKSITIKTIEGKVIRLQ